MGLPDEQHVPQDASWTPGLISYAGPPPTSRRVLDLDLRRSLVAKGYRPTVGIDGSSYVCDWGRSRFEVPADRPVHVSVHVEHRHPVGAASVVLDPDQPAILDYAAPAHLSRAGSLGPRGATVAHGRWLLGCLLVGLSVSLLLLLLFVTTIVVISAT